MDTHLICMQKCSDEELVQLARNLNDDAFRELYERYLPKIHTMTYSFQGLGYDAEDLIQEATLGFCSAIQVYDFKSSSFSTFCYLCIRRMLVSLVRKALRKSVIPESVVIRSEEELISLKAADSPEQEVIAKEQYLKLKEKISTELSEKERKILSEYLKGADYSTISHKLNVSRKTVDNALQRVRKKLR